MNDTQTTCARRRGPSWPLMLAAIVLAGQSAAAVYPGALVTSKEAQADWYRQCWRVRTLQPPAKDLPRGGNLERCDAADLYYDTQHMQSPDSSDWARVRECA